MDEKVTQQRPRTEQWIIGAGGAITALSNPEAEWEEMVTKLNSVLRAFEFNASPPC
jgi:para-aminobenzoate synthetase